MDDRPACLECHAKLNFGLEMGKEKIHTYIFVKNMLTKLYASNEISLAFLMLIQKRILIKISFYDCD